MGNGTSLTRTGGAEKIESVVSRGIVRRIMNYVVLPVGVSDFFAEQSFASWDAFCKKNKAELVRLTIVQGDSAGKPWNLEWDRWEKLLKFLASVKGKGERVIFADPRNTLCLPDCGAEIFGQKGDPIAVDNHRGDRLWRVNQMVEAAASFGAAEFAPESYVDDGLVVLDGDSSETWIVELLKFRRLGFLPSTVLSWMLHRIGRKVLKREKVLNRNEAELVWAKAAKK